MPEPSETLKPFRTVREILDFVLALHMRRIEQCDVATSNGGSYRRRAVVSYLRDAEEKLAAAIARYEQSDAEVLSTLVQGVPVAALARAQASGPLGAELTDPDKGDPESADSDRAISGTTGSEPGDEAEVELAALLREYSASDQALLELYEQLEASMELPSAKAMFADLAELERRNQARLHQALLDF